MSKIHKKTLNCLQQQLLVFDFTINYRKGDLNTAADALSRNVPTGSGEPDLAVDKFISSMSDESGSIFMAQKNDLLISDIKQFLAKNVFPAKANPGYKQKIERLAKDCFVERNLLWVNLNRQGGLMRSVLFCPDSLKKIVLEAAHCSPMSGHSGKQRTIDRVELGYWWPGLTYDVANFCWPVIGVVKLLGLSLLLHRCSHCQLCLSRVFGCTWICSGPSRRGRPRGRSTLW